MKNKIIILFLAIIITFTYGNFAEASVVIKEANINNSNSKINTNKINENIYSKNNRNYIDNNFKSKDLNIESSLEHDLKSSPDSCVKCYTMFLPFLLIKIDVFS